MASKTVSKHAKIEEKHEEYVQEHDINVSYLLRQAIEKQMQKDQG